MKNTMTNRSVTKWAIYLALVATTTGCSMGKQEGWSFTKAWDVRRAIGLEKDELAPPQVPSRLVSTWTDTTLNRQGETPKRGFGGRLLFFNEASEDAIRVAGQLVVYAYDDSGRMAHETQPTRRFVFPTEQFTRHESESKVGPSYSVWLPWDEVGGAQKNISLIARFEPTGGPLVVGEQTRHLLPGVQHLASGESKPASKPISDIRLTQFSQASQVVPSVASTPTGPNQRPQVTSIALARKNWAQRLNLTDRSQPSRAANSAAPEKTIVLPEQAQ